MAEIIKQNSELEDLRKNEILQMMSNTSLNPILAESEEFQKQVHLLENW